MSVLRSTQVAQGGLVDGGRIGSRTRRRCTAPQALFGKSEGRQHEKRPALGSKGSLRLYLDSASVMQWDRWSKSQLYYGVSAHISECASPLCCLFSAMKTTEMFNRTCNMNEASPVGSRTGFTTNPSILLRDQVPACNLRTLSILADQVSHFPLPPSYMPCTSMHHAMPCCEGHTDKSA